MIDDVFKTVKTILNKENDGHITPEEFNIIANNIQNEIFRGYFEDHNLDQNKENRGLTNPSYSNLPFNERQRIGQFSAIETLDGVVSSTYITFPLPSDIYLMEDNGLTAVSGTVIEEVERSSMGYLGVSSASPSSTYPIYERYSNEIRVYPEDAVPDSGVKPPEVVLRYLRMPAAPKWTYIEVGGNELFNQGSTTYQDFELHPSEFTNIVLRMTSLFGINLREADVVKITEQLRDKLTLKDNA